MTEKWCHEVMVKKVWYDGFDDLTLVDICEAASNMLGTYIGAKNVADRIVEEAIRAGVVERTGEER